MPACTTLKLSAGRLRRAIRGVVEEESAMATRLAWLATACMAVFWTALLSTGAQLSPLMVEDQNYTATVAGEVVRAVSAGGYANTQYVSRAPPRPVPVPARPTDGVAR
jgi:hypothetical protein